jgi:hypothetical protein
MVVDVLDDLLLACIAARNRLLEGVEVDAHEIDLLDPLLAGGLQVGVLVAAREQPRIQPWVQRLDATVHDLGKAGEVLYRAHLNAGVGQRL